MTQPAKTEPLFPEDAPESEETKLIQVAVPPLGHLLTYKVAKERYNDSLLGYQVRATIGNREKRGYVYRDPAPPPESSKNFELKEIESDQIEQPAFDESLCHFLEWTADYYDVPLSRVLDTAIPKQVPLRSRRQLVLNEPDSLSGRAGKTQRGIVRLLEERGGTADYEIVTRHFPGASQSIRRLIELGVVEQLSLELNDAYLSKEPLPGWAKTQINLTDGQQTFCEHVYPAIDSQDFTSSLLHGETGSGKTEIYIACAKRALERDLDVLVLVPEIALTPQLIRRFRAQLGDNIAMLHSGIRPRERWEAWKAILEGRCRIAIGARSAIFAPLKNIGLVVVDEEHDGSFKQSDGIRYSARDLAIVRAKLSSCPIILGSATPSLESFYNARSGKYFYFSLPAFHASKNTVHVIDLSKKKRSDFVSEHLSAEFVDHLQTELSAKRQAFILYNRRGFASYLQCSSCEHVFECPNCSVTLTVHKRKNALLCHYCGLESAMPSSCPNCTGGEGLAERGAGTERIYDEIQSLFPHVSIARLDRDMVSNLESYNAILDRLRKGEIQLLVGTQMIAKGHDLPDVGFVGVVDADVGIHFPDFRSSERTYQLLTQVAGRAGRSERGGRVIFQTRAPEHPAIVHSASEDYERFAFSQLSERKELGYPPFRRLLRIVAQSSDQAIPMRVLHEMREILPEDAELSILGPSVCPIERVKTMWRAHMLLRAESSKSLRTAQRRLKQLKISRRCRVSFDLDPLDTL